MPLSGKKRQLHTDLRGIGKKAVSPKVRGGCCCFQRWRGGILGCSSSTHQTLSCYCSVTKSCPTLCNPVDYSSPGFPVLHKPPEFAQTHVLELIMPSNHLILCGPLLLLSSIFPSTRVLSSESDVHIRWPKYWSFSFNISPSNGYSRFNFL